MLTTDNANAPSQEAMRRRISIGSAPSPEASELMVTLLSSSVSYLYGCLIGNVVKIQVCDMSDMYAFRNSSSNSLQRGSANASLTKVCQATNL